MCTGEEGDELIYEKIVLSQDEETGEITGHHYLHTDPFHIELCFMEPSDEEPGKYLLEFKQRFPEGEVTTWSMKVEEIHGQWILTDGEWSGLDVDGKFTAWRECRCVFDIGEEDTGIELEKRANDFVVKSVKFDAQASGPRITPVRTASCCTAACAV